MADVATINATVANPGLANETVIALNCARKNASNKSWLGISPERVGGCHGLAEMSRKKWRHCQKS